MWLEHPATSVSAAWVALAKPAFGRIFTDRAAPGLREAQQTMPPISKARRKVPAPQSRFLHLSAHPADTPRARGGHFADTTSDASRESLSREELSPKVE
jgi:hypothetical protein